MNNKDEIFITIFIIFTIILIISVPVSIWKCYIKPQMEFETFKIKHDCKITARISGRYPKTGYTCDDGITYFY